MYFFGQQKRGFLSFDSELIDANGDKILIDCQINLPNICGEQVEILMGIPYYQMPINSFNNPCKIETTCDYTGKHIVMNEIWYRNITNLVYPLKKIGISPISLTHIANLCITEKYQSIDNKILVYVSKSDFFEDSISKQGFKNEFIEDLFDFKCPNLGQIQMQRYWVKNLISHKNRYLLSSGYCLSIPVDNPDFTIEDLLKNLEPILNIFSILLRQRITILGWELYTGDIRKRFWIYPLEPIKTKYVGVELGYYLVSHEGFEKQVNTALANYAQLDEQKKELIHHLSYSLSPAIELKDPERFMSLFRGLELQSEKLLFKNKELTCDDKLLINKLNEILEYFSKENPAIEKRISGLIKQITENSPSLKDKLKFLFNNVNNFNLWEIDGKKGLAKIRNKLTHKGSFAVNHQGLAVATWHLAILTECLIFQIIGLDLESIICEQINRDEWAQPIYWNKLKNRIFE